MKVTLFALIATFFGISASAQTVPVNQRWLRASPEELYCRPADNITQNISVELYRNYFKPSLRQLLFIYRAGWSSKSDQVTTLSEISDLCETDFKQAKAKGSFIFVNIGTGQRIIDDGQFVDLNDGFYWTRHGFKD